MSYTPEQLSKMSNVQIECALHLMLNPDREKITNTLESLNFHYCTDWSVTGPLMVEYGVCVERIGRIWYARKTISLIGNEWRSGNENPLRAVCEVLLQMPELP